MPFVRFSRDRRGYEHTYLIHAAPRRGAPTRILYWYRTPPGVKVGREAFDLEARRILEAQYPSVPFDWPKLLETQMPSAEAENWRERRRVERSARLARQIEDPEDVAAEPIEIAEPAQAQPIQEPAVDALPVVGDAGGAAESAGTESASKKRRRRGGRRRRRQGSQIGSGRPANQASDGDVDSLRTVQSRSAAEMDSSAAPSQPPPATADLGMKSE